MKFDYHVILACSIVLLISLQYLLLSISFHEMTILIVGNNPMMAMFGNINNATLFVFPIMVFGFLVVSVKLMLDFFDIIALSSRDIIIIVGYSLIPVLLGMCFYNVSVVFFMQENPRTLEEIEVLHFLFGLQIKDFALINQVCWLMMYYLIWVALYFKHKVSLIRSLSISVLPSLLFLLFSNMIKYFGHV